MNRHSVWSFVLAVIAAAPLALAQGGAGSTGSIQGEVLDESGAVLPGVTVTASGTTLLGAQTATTNTQGVYRFPGLPAGTYKLTFELSGFSKVSRDDIRIGIGFTASVNAKLSVKTLQEEVTVTGEATIDTTATRVQTNFSQEQLDALPNARDMWSLLAETPAVTLNRFDVGGSTAGTQTTYVAYGNGGQNRPLVEGINTTEGTSASGFYFDYGSFDEVVVGAAGNSAEMPSGGVITNFIGKSGGNQWKGQVYYEYENKNVQSTNVTEDQLNRGFANLSPAVIQQLGLKRDEANTLLDYKNLNLDIGGPIVKDKLWAWGGYLRQQNVTYQPASGAILDGTEFLTELVNYTGKLTYQITAKDKFIGYLQYGIKKQPFRTDASPSGQVGNPVHATSASTLDQNSPSWVGKIEYNRTFGNRGFFEVRAGEFGYNFGLVNYSQDPRKEDRTTGAISGGGRDWELDRRRKQLHGAYTFYKDDILGGNHQLKLGGEIQDETGNTIWNQFFSNNVVQYFNNGVASVVRLGLPSSSWSGLRNYGLFASDTYSLDRLTLNLGVRYDRYRVFLPEQARPASRFSPQAATFPAVSDAETFNHVVPRLGATYDVRGNGKTVLKASLGRYYFNPGATTLGDAVNPNPANQYSDYAWTDRNGDGLWQPGEEGVLQRQVGGASNVLVDPNLKNSHTNELSTWIEQALPNQIGLRAEFVWKKDQDGYQQFNPNRPLSAYDVPTTVADPGPDGALGTGDDRTQSAYNLNPANLALPVANALGNQPGFEAEYKSVELAANKRFSRKYSLTASFLYTWTDEFAYSYYGNSFGTQATNPSLFGGNSGNGSFPLSPNDDIHNTFTSWNLKAFGSYEPGWGVRLSPVFRAQSGQPYGRTFSTNLNYGSQLLLAEPIGTRQQETVKILDLRAEKKFKLGVGRSSLAVIADVFNVLNANTELNIRWGTGTLTVAETGARITSFGTPITILPPRIMRLSARLSF